ncbi:hypothetical protein [Bradyrhizobium sp. CCGUVB23]|uniref:hypothetical protein n=1 Tax=Bradyrhizobium sp. CCGUVB23 TaxID=2949630 RepID=UPI0020B4354F|nr:hypothetical protein [Bradyrhizobium sp. CCGUVB23]MCP3468639.1 hypothetical protein [Bradyrhizobium sp. CCGUVB23]
MTVKTGRKDAHGIAQLANGLVSPGVCQIIAGLRYARAQLVGRKLLWSKILGVKLSIRGIIRSYGAQGG